jgi:UDP-galactose transporter
MISIPGLLFTVQNNLSFVALSYIDAATFQVTSQLKILTTALMSVIILKTKLTFIKWISLFLLMIGVSTTEVYLKFKFFAIKINNTHLLFH